MPAGMCDACSRVVEGFHPVVLESVDDAGYRLCARCGAVLVAVVREIQRSRGGGRPFGLTKLRRREEALGRKDPDTTDVEP